MGRYVVGMIRGGERRHSRFDDHIEGCAECFCIAALTRKGQRQSAARFKGEDCARVPKHE